MVKDTLAVDPEVGLMLCNLKERKWPDIHALLQLRPQQVVRVLTVEDKDLVM